MKKLIQYQGKNITVFESQLFKTTSTVIHTDHFVLVVDPTWLPFEIEEIKTFVHKVREEKPLYLLFTHSDFDHILGYGAFLDATVIATREFQKRQDKEKIVEEILSFDDEYYIDRPYDVQYPSVDIVVEKDEQSLVLGDEKITFYKAPGHTNDGLFTVIEPLGIFIAGDYLSDVEFPFIYDSVTNYEKTLNKAKILIEQKQINVLVPGHGKVTDYHSEIIKRYQDSIYYIEMLKRAVKTGKEEIETFIHSYCYPRALKKAHKENIDLLKKELN